MAGAGDVDGRPRVVNGRADIGAYELGGLLARFVAYPRVAEPGDVVTFASAAVGTNVGGTRYSWDFDNSGSCEQWALAISETAWQCSTEGVYSERLVVSNAVGEGVSQLQQKYITIVPECGVRMRLSACIWLYGLSRHAQGFRKAVWSTPQTHASAGSRSEAFQSTTALPKRTARWYVHFGENWV